MKLLAITNSIRKISDNVLVAILGVIISSMVCLVLWQIISRAVLAAPSTITEELVRFELIWLGVLGAVYAYSQKQHIRITIFVDMIPPKYKKYLNWFINAVVLIFLYVILFN